MIVCESHDEQRADFVDKYQNWKHQDCPWCRIAHLELKVLELAECKAKIEDAKLILALLPKQHPAAQTLIDEFMKIGISA